MWDIFIRGVELVFTPSMTTHPAIDIDENGDRLTISEYSTTDSDITQYFSDLDQEERDAQLETALRVGVLALRSSQTVEQVDYVDKRFQEVQQRFEKRVEDLLGEDGQVPEYVDEHFGEDGKLVNDVFDPSDSDTPIGQLKKSVNEMFTQLRTDLEIEEKEDELKEQTRFSGQEFEERLHDMLGEIVSTTGDKLEPTGEKTGLLGTSKKGDFVVELRDISRKIAVEAKDTYTSQNKIEDEMEEAMDNRGATYGLFVARSTDTVPKSVGRFNEYNRNILVIILSEDEEKAPDQELLEVGYKWAQMRVMEQEVEEGEEIDMAEIRSEIEAAERSLGSFKTIRGKCTSIEKAVDDIREEVNELQGELEDNIETVLDTIN